MAPFKYWFDGPALAAGVAFITSMITLGLSWYSASTNRFEEARSKELASREVIIQRLTQFYMVKKGDAISPEMLAGFALPPTEWLDAQLAAMKKNWRMADREKFPSD